MAAGSTPRVRKAQRREDEVRAVAAELFYRKGYLATSTQDIGDELGLLKGSLYYYISSKEELLFSIIKEAHFLLFDVVRRAKELPDPLSRLRYATEAHVECVAANIIPISIFYNDVRSLSEEHREEIIGERRRYEGEFRTLIEDAQKSGDLSPDLDAQLATKGLLGMINWVYRWYKADGALPADQIAAQLASILMGGMRAPF